MGGRAWQGGGAGCEADLVWPPCLGYAPTSVTDRGRGDLRAAAPPRGR